MPTLAWTCEALRSLKDDMLQPRAGEPVEKESSFHTPHPPTRAPTVMEGAVFIGLGVELNIVMTVWGG